MNDPLLNNETFTEIIGDYNRYTVKLEKENKKLKKKNRKLEEENAILKEQIDILSKSAITTITTPDRDYPLITPYTPPTCNGKDTIYCSQTTTTSNS